MSCWLEESNAMEGFADTLAGVATAVGATLIAAAWIKISAIMDKKRNPQKADAEKAIDALTEEEAITIYMHLVDRYASQMKFDEDMCFVFSARNTVDDFDYDAYEKYQTYYDMQNGEAPRFIRGNAGKRACANLIKNIKQSSYCRSLNAKLSTVDFPNGLYAVFVEERNSYTKKMGYLAFSPVEEIDADIAFSIDSYNARKELENHWNLFVQYYEENKTTASAATEGFGAGLVLGFIGELIIASNLALKKQAKQDASDPYLVSRSKLDTQLKNIPFEKLAESVALVLQRKKNEMIITGTPAKNLCKSFEKLRNLTIDDYGTYSDYSEYRNIRARNTQNVWYIILDTDYGNRMGLPIRPAHDPEYGDWSDCFEFLGYEAIVAFFMENMDVIQQALNDAGNDIQIAVESDICWLAE